MMNTTHSLYVARLTSLFTGKNTTAITTMKWTVIMTMRAGASKLDILAMKRLVMKWVSEGRIFEGIYATTIYC